MDRIEARLPAVLVGLALAVLAVLVLSACTSGASGDVGGSEPMESAYAQCLRDNGAAPPDDAEDFDPNGLAAAQEACADLLPEGAPGGGFGGGLGPPGATPPGGAPSEEQIAELVQCLSDQGLDVPEDPTELPGALDPSDPATREAIGACLGGGGAFGP